MARIPKEVIAFAGGTDKLGLYEMFADYYNHWEAKNGKKGVEYQETVFDEELKAERKISFAEKEEQLNAELKKEIMRHAGITDYTAFPVETWANHPTLKWATFAVVSAMIDMVFPMSIIDTIGLYSDVRVIGWGDSTAFDIDTRDIFAVSKAGRSRRRAELRKQFRGQVTIIPELREMSVFVSLMKVLAGKESLAPLVAKMVRSFETALSYDVYSTFYTAMEAVDNTADTGLRVAGFSDDAFVRISQQVRAWNGGATAVAVGTQRALANILPDDANYRFDLNSEYVRLGYISNYKGTSVMVLPQVADWETPFGLKLSDSRIWFISPTADKLVKVVLEGSTLAHTDDVWANANLVQTSTMLKSWGTGIATSAVAGIITLS